MDDIRQDGSVPTRAARVLGVAMFYATLVTWLTWPLAARLTSGLPDSAPTCRFDPLGIGWALAHETAALLGDPTSFVAGNIYHPAERTILYTESSLGALPYFLPTFALTGNPTAALNLLFLGGVALTACALHMVVRGWTHSHPAGFVAAAAFLSARWVLWRWLPCAPNYAVLVYLPVILLLASRSLATVGARVTLLVLVVLQGLVSPYLLMATLPPLILIASWRLVRRTRRREGLRLAGTIATAIPLVGLAFAGQLLVRLENPELGAQTVWRRHRLHASVLPWDLLDPEWAAAVAPATFGLIVLGCIARRAGRARPSAIDAAGWRHAAVWAVVGLVAALPPTIVWAGYPIALPQKILASWTPIYDLIRFPQRLAVASLIGVSVLAGLAFAECTALRPVLRRASPALALAVAALLYVEYASGTPVPDRRVGALPREYPVYRPVGADAPLMDVLRRETGPLLELPIGPELGGDTTADAPLQARATYRSIFHRRKILNGYASYWPQGFPERMALARRLPDPDAIERLRVETGLAQVLVHVRLLGQIEREVCRALAGRNVTSEICRGEPGRAQRERWLALAANGGGAGLQLVARTEDDLLFQVVPAR